MRRFSSFGWARKHETIVKCNSVMDIRTSKDAFKWLNRLDGTSANMNGRGKRALTCRKARDMSANHCHCAKSSNVCQTQAHTRTNMSCMRMTHETRSRALFTFVFFLQFVAGFVWVFLSLIRSRFANNDGPNLAEFEWVRRRCAQITHFIAISKWIR